MSIIKKVRKQILDNDIKELITKSGVFVFFKVCGALLGYIFALYVTKKFGSQNYGLVSLGLAIFMILSIFGKFGWDLNLTKYVAGKLYKKKDLNTLCANLVIRSFFVTSFISLLIVINKSYIATVIFDKPQFESHLFWVAISFPFWSSVLIFAGFFRGFRKNTLFSIFNTFGRFFLTVTILLGVVLVAGTYSEDAPLMAHFFASATLLIGCLIIARLIFQFDFDFRRDFNLKTFFAESNPMFIASMIFILMTWIDRVILGLFKSETELAVYDVSSRLAILVSFNLDAINSILAPKIAKFYAKGEKKKMKDVIRFSTNMGSLLAIIVFLPIFFYGEYLLGLFGEEYKEGKIILQILSVGQLFSCLAGSVGIILQMTNHQNYYKKIILQGLVLNLVLNIFLINKIGVVGVAIATSAGLIFWNLYGALIVFKKVGVISFFNPFILTKK